MTIDEAPTEIAKGARVLSISEFLIQSEELGDGQMRDPELVRKALEIWEDFVRIRPATGICNMDDSREAIYGEDRP